MEVLILLVCIAMTIVALWRLPAIRYGDPLRRSLWGCSAGFAVALWTRFPPVKHTLDQVGIVDFDALVKYLVSMGASLALLSYAVTSYGVGGDDAPRHIAICRRVARVSQRATIVVIPLMVLLFFTVIPRKHPSQDFAADHAGQLGAAFFMTCFYLYLGSSAATCAYQWAHVSRRAESAVLRTGLTLGAASTWLYTAYSVLRLSYMWIAEFAPTGPALDAKVAATGNALNVLAAALFAAGASLPTTGVAAQRWAAWRMLWRLYPLRRDLTKQFPGVTFQPPAGRIREITCLWPPVDVRLDRVIQECGDAVDQLRHHATPELWSVVSEATAGHSDPETAAEAYWIAAALRSASNGRRSPLPVQALPDKPFATSQAEAWGLAHVQAVYAGISAGEVTVILTRAGEPPVNSQ
ncbi:MAB_1171c family putative transporter [Streptomyces sp. NPDC020096]